MTRPSNMSDLTETLAQPVSREERIRMNAVAKDPVTQGQLLRQDLTDRVRLAMRTGEVHRRLKERMIDVNENIKKYVPDGSTFDYAEKVLQSAGFELEARPTPESPGRFVSSEFEFDVNAGLGFGQEQFEGGVRCAVTLRPAGPYDYGSVHRVLVYCGYYSL